MALMREAGAVVTMGTYWAWETSATLHLLSAVHEAPGYPQGEERGGGISCRHAHSLLFNGTFSINMLYCAIQVQCTSRRAGYKTTIQLNSETME